MSGFDVSISSGLILDSDHRLINGFSLKFVCQMPFFQKDQAFLTFIIVSIYILLKSIYPTHAEKKQVDYKLNRKKDAGNWRRTGNFP